MSAVIIIYAMETVQFLLSPIVMEYYRARIHCERKTKPEGKIFKKYQLSYQKLALTRYLQNRFKIILITL